MRTMYGKGSLSGNESTLQAEKNFRTIKKKKICNRAVNQKSIWKEHDSKKYNGDNIFFYYCNA